MKTLTELIQNYQNGIPDSDSEILKRMEPLVKGYASRIHCMEREDSTQELYLTLLKTLPYLSSSSSEGECIRYMQCYQSLYNKPIFQFSCKIKEVLA